MSNIKEQVDVRDVNVGFFKGKIWRFEKSGGPDDYSVRYGYIFKNTHNDINISGMCREEKLDECINTRMKEYYDENPQEWLEYNQTKNSINNLKTEE